MRAGRYFPHPCKTSDINVYPFKYSANMFPGPCKNSDINFKPFKNSDNKTKKTCFPPHVKPLILISNFLNTVMIYLRYPCKKSDINFEPCIQGVKIFPVLL